MNAIPLVQRIQSEIVRIARAGEHWCPARAAIALGTTEATIRSTLAYLIDRGVVERVWPDYAHCGLRHVKSGAETRAQRMRNINSLMLAEAVYALLNDCAEAGRVRPPSDRMTGVLGGFVTHAAIDGAIKRLIKVRRIERLGGYQYRVLIVATGKKTAVPAPVVRARQAQTDETRAKRSESMRHYYASRAMVQHSVVSAPIISREPCPWCGVPGEAEDARHDRCGKANVVEYVALPKAIARAVAFEPYRVGAGA